MEVGDQTPVLDMVSVLWRLLLSGGRGTSRHSRIGHILYVEHLRLETISRQTCKLQRCLQSSGDWVWLQDVGGWVFFGLQRGWPCLWTLWKLKNDIIQSGVLRRANGERPRGRLRFACGLQLFGRAAGNHICILSAHIRSSKNRLCPDTIFALECVPRRIVGSLSDHIHIYVDASLWRCGIFRAWRGPVW